MFGGLDAAGIDEMPSSKSPLTGYNHNLKYKGRIYHVQTEDSGLKAPHVFTHLFHDGIIVSSKKSDYNHVANLPDREEQLRKIMQGQHKDMMKELLSGKHDEKITQYFGTLIGEDADAEVPSSFAMPGVVPDARKKAPAAAAPAQPQQPPAPANRGIADSRRFPAPSVWPIRVRIHWPRFLPVGRGPSRRRAIAV